MPEEKPKRKLIVKQPGRDVRIGQAGKIVSKKPAAKKAATKKSSVKKSPA